MHNLQFLLGDERGNKSSFSHLDHNKLSYYLQAIGIVLTFPAYLLYLGGYLFDLSIYSSGKSDLSNCC